MEKPKPHVSDYKKKVVKDIVNLISQYPIIGAVNMENLPTMQLQQMRAQLRDKVVLTMTKRRLIKIAIEQSKEKKKGIEKLEPYLRGMPALIFTKDNPFSLFKILKKNKSPAPAKPGQTAPKDIIVNKGPTSFAPGPIIGELAVIGIKAGVEGGKVIIREDSVVVKEGEKIKANAAAILTRLGIEPMEVGLDLTAVYENGTIYEKKVLDIDEEKFNVDLQNAASYAINLSVFAGYPTKETIELMLSQAFNDAKALGLSQNIIDKGIIEDLLGKAEQSMLSLKTTANIQVQEKPKEKKEEKPKEEIKAEIKKEEPKKEIEKKEEEILEKEKEIIKEEGKVEKEAKEKEKKEAPIEKEVEEAAKEEEEKQLEKERIEKEKELERLEKEKEAKKKAEEEERKQEEQKKAEEERRKKEAEEQRKKQEELERKKAEELKRIEEEKKLKEAEEERKKQEEVRRKAEETKKLEEQKRKEAEEKARLEEEKRKAEEQRKLEEERKRKEAEELKRKQEEETRRKVEEEARRRTEEAKKSEEKRKEEETEKKVAEMVKRMRMKVAGKEPTAEKIVEEIKAEKPKIPEKPEKVPPTAPKLRERTAEELVEILHKKGTLRGVEKETMKPLKKEKKELTEEEERKKKEKEQKETEDLAQELIKKGTLRK